MEQALAITFIANDEFRKKLTELAIQALKHGVTFDIGTSTKKPTYRLAPPNKVPANVLKGAVPVRPERARKKLNTIRAMLRVLDDMAFGIEIGGEVVAILTRHPSLDLADIREFRQEHLKRRRAAGANGVKGAKAVDG
jgi:hypothetical protein